MPLPRGDRHAALKAAILARALRNTVRILKDGPRWCALIGPDLAVGVAYFGDDPMDALFGLIETLDARGYRFEGQEPDGQAEAR